MLKEEIYHANIVGSLAYIDFLSEKYKYLCSGKYADFISYSYFGDEESPIIVFYDKIIILDYLKIYIKQCIKNKKRFVAIPVTLKPRYYNNRLTSHNLDKNYIRHANILIYDTIRKELEHFEHHNVIEKRPITKKKLEVAEFVAKSLNKNIGPGTVKKWYNPIRTCPSWIQKLQKEEIKREPEKYKHITENTIRGFCHYWCLFYLETRIANPNIKRKDILEIAMSKIKSKTSLTHFIRMYSSFVNYIVDKVYNTKRKNKIKYNNVIKKLFEKYT